MPLAYSFKFLERNAMLNNLLEVSEKNGFINLNIKYAAIVLTQELFFDLFDHFTFPIVLRSCQNDFLITKRREDK